MEQEGKEECKGWYPSTHSGNLCGQTYVCEACRLHSRTAEFHGSHEP